MNPRNILLLLLSLTSISCSDSSNKTFVSSQGSSKEVISDSVKKNRLEPHNIPTDIDSKFETFIKYFSKDSLFQISRIDFPLKVKTVEGEEETETTINKSDFRKLNFGDQSAKTRQFDKYEEKFKVNGNKAVIETRGIDNGIFIDIYFQKEKGKWKLLTWVDSSD